jgi:pimeloyl-ACP methyl ester carboxylesterase
MTGSEPKRLQLANVELAYDDMGTGSPPMLLLHGFSCNRTDFVHQLTHFSEQHRVLAFDQRGHGQSSLAHDGSYGFGVDVSDAHALCDELGINRPIVVGHSLGGVSALKLAAEPGFASALVLLDSTIELPDEVEEQLEAFVEGLERSSDEEFQEQVRQYARAQMIDPSDDAEEAGRLIERSANVPKDVYVAGVKSIIGVDVRALALSVTVPTLFIGSSLPWLDLGRVHTLRPDWFLGRTVGAGHFHHLLVPDQVNAMVDRFLASIDAGFPQAAPSPW